MQVGAKQVTYVHEYTH